MFSRVADLWRGTRRIAPPATELQPDLKELFRQLAAGRRPTTALEIGTAQTVPGRPTHNMDLVPWIERAKYVMADIKAGTDVDVIADLHGLPAEWSGRFGAFLANAVFEHLERPWIAAREAVRVLEPGGLCLVCTHQTFPLHGHPQDFFRFSKEALRLIFEDAGLEVIEVAYQHRCIIVPPEVIVPVRHVEFWNRTYPSYILVNLVGRKPG